MNDKRNMEDLALDKLLAQAAAKPVIVPADLMQRIEADAHLVADAGDAARRSQPDNQSGFWAVILAAIGGWPAIAGLATATVAGVWIGFSPTSSIGGIADGYLTNTTYYDVGDFMPSIDDFLNEG